MKGEGVRDRDVAIVGMACVFPGAPDLAAFWRNIEAGVDATTEVPPARWDPAVFYDPSSSAPDRFYCKRGGFIDAYARFDALAFGVMPVAAHGAEPDQLMMLEVAHAALLDAGYLPSGVTKGRPAGSVAPGPAPRTLPRERAGIVIGRGNYIGAGMTRLEQHVRTAEQLVSSLRTLLPQLDEAALAGVKREFQKKLGAYGPDTAIGLVPNLTASRIANRLDLMGPAYTVDGACASSLLAVEEACEKLVTHRADLMLAGGVHLSHDVAFWSVFCQLGALSRQQRIRPFHRDADGILIGEGLGLVVCKRLADALDDDDRIYAVIRGLGVASDGRESSLMTPRVDGQLLALSRAYAAAGLAPETVGLVEGHGTGTPAGDTAELTTLARFYGPADPRKPRSVLGSVKSNIGHAMPAAGIAGLIKATLAVYTGVAPPSLHCDEPHPLLAETRFEVPSVARPWTETTVLRRAGVSAFGFGGINAHVVLQAFDEAPVVRGSVRRAVGPGRGALPEDAGGERILLLAERDTAELARALERGDRELRDGPARLALVDPTPERRARALELVRRGVAVHGRGGVDFSPSGYALAGGQVAFLFPGVEAAFAPQVEDIAAAFERPAPQCAAPRNLEEQGFGVIAVARFLFDVLHELGVRPDALAGHSIGEWAALIAAGMLDADAADDFIATLSPGTLVVPGVVFAAAGCGAEEASRAMAGLPDIGLSHDNCPHQVILCGAEPSIDIAMERLRGARVLSQKLPFRSGFHSPLFEPYLGPHRTHLARVALGPPSTPLWSATTCAPYPAARADIHKLVIDHLVQPVRFRELTLALHASGVRIFVQLGPASLTGFVDDTLRELPHVALSANVAQRSGLSQLRRVAAALFVQGVPVDLLRLGLARPAVSRTALTLSLGVPLVQLDTPLALSAPALVEAPGTQAPRAPGALSRRLASAFDGATQSLARARDDVAAAFERKRVSPGVVASAPDVRPTPSPPPPKAAPLPSVPAQPGREVTSSWSLSVERAPHLLDHCFFRQPDGWPTLVDRYPVVPMTATITRMIDAARALAPGRVVVGLENMRAFRWIAVEPPLEVAVHARHDGADRVTVSVAGYAEATLRLAERYPPAAAPTFAPLPPRPTLVSAERLYSEHWMFHGPGYQGIRAMNLCGDATLGGAHLGGISGTLEVLPAEGALLDNAGQLFGYWVMEHTDRDRLAMPVKVDRIEFFADEPPVGTRLRCEVRVTHLASREVRADLELSDGERVYARISGWEDWRFESDDRLWPILREPDRHLFSEVCEGGAFVRLRGAGRTSASRDYLARRFLVAAERVDFDNAGPRGQRPFVLGRIAAKDAARAHLWRTSPTRSIFPVEVRVHNDASGRPVFDGDVCAGLHVSISHKDDVAVACVGEGPVGIDVERIEPRSDAMEALVFSDAERALVVDRPRDEWLTRLWCAKEAVAKARGVGLGGRPRDFEVDAIEGERMRCAGHWVETRREGEEVVAWVRL